jgi:hypothetical protein
MSMDVDMDVDNSPIAIKGSAPGQQSVAFRGESGPVTIEIENLDPGTTTDDVKVYVLCALCFLLHRQH